MRSVSRRVAEWSAILPSMMLIAACRPAAIDLADVTVSNEWTRSYPLAPTGDVVIYTREGGVTVEGVGGATTVEVVATRVARAKSEKTANGLLPAIQINETIKPERIEIRTARIEGILVAASYLVNYRIKVPSRAKVRAETGSGDVVLSGIAGSVVGISTNGKVTGTDLRGPVEARSTNGSLKISMGAIGNSPISLRTVNGSIDLLLPSIAHANVNAQTRNGKISTGSLPFETISQPQRGRSPRLRGTINGGGPSVIELQTVSGDITLEADQPQTP